MSSRSILFNTFAQFGGKILTVLASFIVVKLVAGYGKEFYGNYVTAYEYLAFFGILADAGLFTVAVRDISKLKKKKDQQKKTEFILGNILSMRLCLIFGATLFAGIVAQALNYPDIVQNGIWITGISMALTIIAGTLSSILQARMKIQYFSMSMVLGKLSLAALVFFIIQNEANFEHLFYTLLWAGVISNVIFLALVYHFARREARFSLQFDKEYWITTITKSLPFGIALILQTLYLRADLIIISLLLGSAAVGTYGLGTRVLESFFVLGVFFGQAMIKKLSEDKSPTKIGESIYWAIEKIFIIALPLIIGITAFSQEIIQILGDQEFLSTDTFWGSDKVVIWLIPTILFAYLNQIFTVSLVASERQKKLLIVNAIALALNVTLNLIFIPKHGIQAAAITTIISEILVFSLLFSDIIKHFPLRPNYKNLSLIFAVNLLIFALVYLSPLQDSLLLSVITCGGIYGTFFFVLRKRFL